MSLLSRGSLNTVIFGVRNLGEGKLWKSESLECESWERRQNGATRCWPWRKSRVNTPPQKIRWKLVLSSLIWMGRWQSMVFSSGKLMNWWMIERGHPLFALGQGHNNLSLETTKQHWNCHVDPDHSWRVKDQVWKRERSSINVTEIDEKFLWYGECS